MASGKRLIDADVMRDDWLYNGKNEYVYDTNAVLDSIDSQPTVDAVEVTRCRDCKHYEIHKPKVLENCERNGYIIPMEPDDFCSYGEREEGAD